jgi:hypothetical protein
MVGAAIGIPISADRNTSISFGPEPGGNGASPLDNLTAPASVYSTARAMTDDNNINLQSSLSWNFSVDPGFYHHLRLHFCEFQYSKPNQRVFDVLVNEAAAMTEVDVVNLAGGKDVAVVLDFSVSDVPFIALQLRPTNATVPQYFNAILNGIEIFKWNTSDGNLQGPLLPPLS